MHVILSILAVLGAIAIFVIRANQAAQAARQLGKAASGVKSMIRRNKWQNKSKADIIREIDDPRVAATVMMAAVAQADGELTERQRDAIMGHIRTDLGVGGREATEFFAQGRWLAADAGDLTTTLHRLTGLIGMACSVEEKRQLIDMLTDVAGIENGVSQAQKDAIDRLRRALVDVQ